MKYAEKAKLKAKDVSPPPSIIPKIYIYNFLLVLFKFCIKHTILAFIS